MIPPMCIYMFTDTIDDDAKPKTHQKLAQKTLATGHLHKAYMQLRNWGLKAVARKWRILGGLW